MEYRKVPICKICKLNSSNLSSDDIPNSIYYLDTGNITKNKIANLQFLHSSKDNFPSRAKRRVRDKTIIYSTVRPIQEHYGIIENPVDNLIVSTGFTTIDCIDKNVDAKFLYYYLTQPSITKYLQGIAENSVSAYPSIKPEDIGNLIIEIPKDLYIQKQIASILASLDKKIELNNKINQKLEAMAKMLYDYWFVQFDFPDANSKPYKSSGGKMVYNKEMKREIPEGWKVEKLGNYAEIARGEIITNSETEQGSIKVVAAGVNYSYLHSKSNREKNTITLSSSGANAGYINFWREPIFASDCITVRGKSDIETIMILHYLYLVQKHILNQAKGSAQPHVYPSDIDSLYIPIPSENLIKKYEKIVIPQNDKIAKNLLEIEKLTQLRDWLLPMLMNGQIKISEAANIVQDALMAAEPETGYGAKES